MNNLVNDKKYSGCPFLTVNKEDIIVILSNYNNNSSFVKYKTSTYSYNIVILKQKASKVFLV